MINLLSNEARKKVRALYRLRLLAVVLVVFFYVCLVSIGLLVPSFLLMQGKSVSLSESLNAAQNRPISREADEAVNNVLALNKLINKLSSVPKLPLMGETLDKLFEDKIEGISFESIDYTNQKVITIAGRASTREILLAFTRKLNQDSYFSNVSSPISNLIKSTDINFQITLEHNSSSTPTQ